MSLRQNNRSGPSPFIRLQYDSLLSTIPIHTPAGKTIAKRSAVLYISLFLFCLSSCSPQVADTKDAARKVENFNFGWFFILSDSVSHPFDTLMRGNDWKAVQLPHDWSIEQSYSQLHTGASTGFLPGGIGWYKKTFRIPDAQKDKLYRIEFDGIYTRATVWVNGQLLGHRPNGYISYSYDLSPFLHYGTAANVITVKVDHSQYLDSRWYTGSGIYRNVRLVSTEKIHIPQWGIVISTPEVSKKRAGIIANITVNSSIPSEKEVLLHTKIIDPNGAEVATHTSSVRLGEGTREVAHRYSLNEPYCWDIEHPQLYRMLAELEVAGETIDTQEVSFGLRTFRFDADKGFFLNGRPLKLKGANLHHDAGAVGAAVPTAVLERRLKKLKGIGVNALRTAHNPPAPEFLDLCDQLGLLVIAEVFDEWNRPKAKSLLRLGDNNAPASVSDGYSTDFPEWAEQDLKDGIRRDRNHPCIILWSIGNEIEWTYPSYSRTYDIVNGKQEYYAHVPSYDSVAIAKTLDSLVQGQDSLLIIAQQLNRWVKEMDSTRPTTCGNVHPSIGLAGGYGRAVDILGFNYRAIEYDMAHSTYPHLKIYGSENWGTFPEWQACLDRDFVAGIFVWTGIAYMGESGPWPEKGLNVSFFDFGGFKTPRGHFFEALWSDRPKVYAGTVPLEASEFAYKKEKGWSLDLKKDWIRRWQWYELYDHWNYGPEEKILVQGYTNTESAELFLNGQSMGERQLADTDDHILKWVVPFAKGKLRIVGKQQGKVVDEYTLSTHGPVADISLRTERQRLLANREDVVHIVVELRDAAGHRAYTEDDTLSFTIEGPYRLLGMDNGASNNVQHHLSDKIRTHNGRSLLMLQSTGTPGEIKVSAHLGSKHSKTLSIKSIIPNQ